MIIRIEKHDRYVIVDKHMLENPELSWKAKGLLAYLLSKPNDWKVMMADLVNHGTGGIESVRSAMTELRDHGYAELRPAQGEDGKMSGKEWVMIERPHRHGGFTDVGENRVSGKPSLGKSAPTKEGSKPKTDKQTKNEGEDAPDLFGDADGNPPQPPSPPPPKLDKSRGTLDDFKAYAVEQGLPATDGEYLFDALESSGWKLSKGAPVKDWRAHMRRYKSGGWLPSQKTTHEKTKPTATRNPQSIHMRQRDPERCAGPATEMATIIDNRHRRNKPLH